MRLKYNFKEYSYKIISQVVMRIALYFFSNYFSNIMKDKLYDNADSFAMSFDEEWKNIDCDDLRLKIDNCLLYTSDAADE